MKLSIRKKAIMTILCILPFVVVILSLCIGRYNMTFEGFKHAVSSFVFSGINTNNDETVTFKIRIPRIIAALLIGGALSTSGVIYQSVFRNPLVSPDLLGASAGAGLGACIAIILHSGNLVIQLSAFAGGLAATGITCLLSNRLLKGKEGVLVYVLIGMVINALLEAGISIIKYVADPNDNLQTITFWLMGSLSKVQPVQVVILAICVIVGIIPLMINRWGINLLSFNDEEAMAMGMNVKKYRLRMIIFSTLLTSASVAIGGIIGWVGLVIPHIVRILVGANSNLLIPASFLVGGIYFVIIDDICRVLLYMEIPVGILTAVIGAPIFILVLLKGGNGWK